MPFRTLLSIVCLLGCAVPVSAAAQTDVLPQTYRANYAVQYRGHSVGHAEFHVAQAEEALHYRFSSRTTATGLARLARPRPIIESSEFMLRDGAIRPIRFEYQDGSRSGSENFTLNFDWVAGTVRADRGGSVTELPLQPGTLDRATLQVALMRDLRSGRLQPRYRLADADSAREYDYRPDGSEPLDTAVGMLDTYRLIQSRAGSNRVTVFWLAPSLGYLPVRIEQRRAGETRTVLLLEGVEGLAADGAPAASR